MMILLRRLGATLARRPPDDIYLDMIALMFAALPPVALLTTSLFVIGIIIVERTGDAWIGILTGGCILAALSRIWIILAYRRWAARADLDLQEACGWEQLFAYTSYAVSALLGALGVRALMLHDPIVHMLVVALLMGYGSGVITRLSIRPRIAIPSLLLAAGPIITASMLHPDSSYITLGAFLAIFLVGSFEAVFFISKTATGLFTARQELAELARSDELTGIPNRLQLREFLKERLDARRGSERLLAVHYLDLDHFKEVNDGLGHVCGDELLRAVAGRLIGVLRPGDMAGRVGGDEFVVVQTDLAHPDEAEMLARRIIRTISMPYQIGSQTVTIGTSVGIALAPRDGHEVKTLVERADAALYRVKGRGRDGLAFWTPSLELRRADQALPSIPA